MVNVLGLNSCAVCEKLWLIHACGMDQYIECDLPRFPEQVTGSHTSWQNCTVATKFTVGVDGKRKALI